MFINTSLSVGSTGIQKLVGSLSSSAIPLFTNVANGTQDFVILNVGDSTEAGVGGNDPFRNNNKTEKLRALFESDGYKTSSDSFFGWGAPSTSSSERVLLTDNRIVSSGTFAKGTTGNPIGFGTIMFSSDSLFAYTPDKDVDTFKIYVVDDISSGDDITYDVDGGSPTTVSLYVSGARTYRVITVDAGSVGQHTLNLSATSRCFLHGIVAYNSTEKQVRLINAGAPGMNGVDFYGSGVGQSANGVIQYIQPDVIKVNFGINDGRKNEITASEFKTEMQTMITGWQTDYPDVDIWLEVPNVISTSATEYEATMTAILELASENNLLLINLRDAFGTYAEALAAGYMNDVLHPNDLGYTVATNKEYSVIKTLSAPVVVVTDSSSLSATNSSYVMDFSAQLTASYDGTSDTWTNIASNTIGDAYLGADATTDGTEPTFNGTAGTAGAYFSLDGVNDRFNLQTRSTLTDQMHRSDSTQPWTISGQWMPANTSNRVIAATCDFSTNAGIAFVQRNSAAQFEVRVFNASGSQIAILLTSSLTFDIGQINEFSFAYDPNTRNYLLKINDAIESGTVGAYTLTDDSLNPLALGSDVGIDFKLGAGTRMYNWGLANTALTEVEMDAIHATFVSRIT